MSAGQKAVSKAVQRVGHLVCSKAAWWVAYSAGAMVARMDDLTAARKAVQTAA